MNNDKLPKYYETFIPILSVLNTDGVLTTSELRIKVRDRFYSHLPKELLDERIKTGGSLILSRIGWGKVYLKQAKMVEQPSRGLVQISEKGKAILLKGKLTLKEIKSDPEFQAYRSTKREEVVKDNISEYESSTPDDLVLSGISQIEDQVKLELLEKIKQIDPYYFEKVVLRLLSKMGYGDSLETAKSGDGGIDGIINQDQLGLEKIYVQAKRYNDHKVHETDIRNFIGAMSGDTTKGIFVTTSAFDAGAEKKVQLAHHKIILIDGKKLVDLMYKYGVGVQIRTTHEVKELDEDFFE